MEVLRELEDARLKRSDRRLVFQRSSDSNSQIINFAVSSLLIISLVKSEKTAGADKLLATSHDFLSYR